jgi:catechol 2,3-dioxygenase-like lactoylglutathione lyase family enzyme
MTIEGIFYVYAKVADLQRAKQFYGETLGWKLHTNEPEVAGFWFGSGYLVAGLDAPATGREGHRDDMHIAVRVSGLDAEHARLAQRGVQVSTIERRPWGERNFSFRDPEGYLWEYGEAS